MNNDSGDKAKAQKHWVKLYVKMLDNPQVAELPDTSYRRFVECLLLAAKEYNDSILAKRESEPGFLPSLRSAAWAAHVPAQQFDDDLSRLALAGLMERKVHPSGEERWFVTNFAKWQGPSESSQRVYEWRDRKAQGDNGNGYGNNNSNGYGNEPVTPELLQSKSKSKSKKQEGEKEAEAEAESALPRAAAAAPSPALLALQEAGIAINKRTRRLAELDPEYVEAIVQESRRRGDSDGLIIRRLEDGDPFPGALSLVRQVIPPEWQDVVKH